MKQPRLIMNTLFIPNLGKRMIIEKKLATDYTNCHRFKTTKGCFICDNSKKICESNLR